MRKRNQQLSFQIEDIENDGEQTWSVNEEIHSYKAGFTLKRN